MIDILKMSCMHNFFEEHYYLKFCGNKHPLFLVTWCRIPWHFEAPDITQGNSDYDAKLQSLVKNISIYINQAICLPDFYLYLIYHQTTACENYNWASYGISHLSIYILPRNCTSKIKIYLPVIHQLIKVLSIPSSFSKIFIDNTHPFFPISYPKKCKITGSYMIKFINCSKIGRNILNTSSN